MAEIGFERHGRHYVHPACEHLFIEFPGTIPLGIGEDHSIVPDEHIVDGTTIKILSPTDCVKDRLATYMYYKDRDGIDQALLVASLHPVNFSSIEKWCKSEKRDEVYQEFLSLLKRG